MPFTPPTTVASQAVTGYLAVLKIGSPLVAMSEIKSFKASLINVQEVPTSHLLSPNNTEEQIPGMIKPGGLEFSGNFIGDAGQLQITTLAANQSTFAFQLIAPVQSGTKTYTLSGNGFFTKYEPGPFENNKAVEYAGAMQLKGAYTETVA